MEKSTRCQSCGMPFFEEGLHGTNTDGYPDADTARKAMMEYFPSLKRWKAA